ncbi:glycosyltransferase [Parapontixanthobacter aurantiacus]|uniref:glycosyltransferase n=1 Tax=Parapontixanthobacter aurantiacus TaxID=1463599 RepID=UPI00301D08FA
MAGPVGYFVHHQGRGHAERAAAIANELVSRRPVTLFSARTDIFPALDERIELTLIPSLFEPTGDENDRLADLSTPETMHCAPCGWPSIRSAMAILAGWFDEAKPSLFVTDVSAELGQFARLCSVPHVAVLQHGERGDAGHMASYEAAIGLLAPYHRSLEQSDRPDWMLRKTFHAAGVGLDVANLPSRDEARRRLDIPTHEDVVVVIGGGGGSGLPTAPLTLGARGEPETRWFTIGKVTSEWHETPPVNLEHKGWVDNPREWIAAADRIVSSCGNTTVHEILAARKPWIVVPEWRYFDEQQCKAEVLEREGLAAVSRTWPSHRGAWTGLWVRARSLELKHRPVIIDENAASHAAEWLNGLALRGDTSSRPGMERLEVVG